MICGTCGFENPDDAVRCEDCGTMLAETSLPEEDDGVVCPQCGAQAPDNAEDDVCRNCGGALKPAAVAKTQPDAEAQEDDAGTGGHAPETPTPFREPGERVEIEELRVLFGLSDTEEPNAFLLQEEEHRSGEVDEADETKAEAAERDAPGDAEAVASDDGDAAETAKPDATAETREPVSLPNVVSTPYESVIANLREPPEETEAETGAEERVDAPDAAKKNEPPKMGVEQSALSVGTLVSDLLEVEIGEPGVDSVSASETAFPPQKGGAARPDGKPDALVLTAVAVALLTFGISAGLWASYLWGM